MVTTHIESKFAAMGARLKVVERGWDTFTLDIQQDRHGEFFSLSVAPQAGQSVDLSVLQILPEVRHLLLLVRTISRHPGKSRYLCGHDERSWFAAAVPGRVSTIDAAKESLKPAEVIAAQDRLALNPKARHTRHNPAFTRQGEWFFLPVPKLAVEGKMVLRNEPIRRGNGQAHMVEQLYRDGGTAVYVCGRFRSGVTQEKYRQLLRDDPKTKRLGWQIMARGAAVYAKGAVRHPDHQTVTLPCWHRVLLSREDGAPGMDRPAFLD